MYFYMLLKLFLIAQLNTVVGVTKQWIQNTNYDNPKNWNVGRLPCDLDTIAFAADSPSVFINSGATTRSMELPFNGEIVLGDGAFIGAAPLTTGLGQSSSQGSCPGQAVQFIRTEPLDWLDANNWQEQGDNAKQYRLDTERVPCLHDDIIFPPGNTFLVKIDAKIQVKSIHISGTLYSSTTIQQFLQSSTGARQFKLSGSGKLEVVDEECKDLTGCACGNDKGDIMSNICDILSPNCTSVYCSSPVTPRGHCCPVCGTVLTLDYGYGFKLDQLKSKIEQDFIVPNKQVYMIMSKLSNDRIQLVILDEDSSKSGASSFRVAENVRQFIEKDISGPKKLGLLGVNVQQSGIPSDGSMGAIRKSRPFFHNAGSIAGVVISIIVLLLIVGGIAYCFVDRQECRKNVQLKLANPFRRFSTETLEMKENMDLENSVGYIDIIRENDGDITFANPTYNLPAAINTNNQNTAETKPSETTNNNESGPAMLDSTAVTFVKAGGNTSFANPLFGHKKSNLSYVDAGIRLNPVYSEEGVEEDSHI